MDDLLGQSLAGYEVVEEIGRGGMATVYKAWQPSLHRYIALKVLHAIFSHDSVFLKRFHREALLAANLSHPHIVKIFNAGEYNGRYFIAMEYLEGGSLKNLLDPQVAGPMDLSTCVAIVSQIGEALEYAHSRGVVHRDIKPSNILLTREGRVVLTDFGIAKAGDSSGITQWGTMIGTVEYMSPEQARGLETDQFSDLYSLGVVLYEMLTGLVPFSGANPYSILLAHLNQRPLLPSRINPSLPKEINKVVLKALAKDKRKRFRRARDLVAALQEASAGAGSVLVGARPEIAHLRREPEPEEEGQSKAKTVLLHAVPSDESVELLEEDKADRLYSQAMEAINAGQWARALELWAEVRHTDPSYPDHHKVAEIAQRELAAIESRKGRIKRSMKPAPTRRPGQIVRWLPIVALFLLVAMGSLLVRSASIALLALGLGFLLGVTYARQFVR